MSNKKLGLFSGRVKKTPSTEVSAERYDWIKLSETEPDLGVPAANGSVLISNTAGNRAWSSTLRVSDVDGSVVIENELYLDQISIVGNQIKAVQSNADLELQTSGSGRVSILSGLSVQGETFGQNLGSFTSLQARDLTEGRLVLVGPAGTLTDTGPLLPTVH